MQETSAALIDQLVYIDNFTMNQDTPNLDVDGQLSLDLAAFADDSFIFADEEKPDRPIDDESNDDFHANDEKHDPLPVSFRELPDANNPLENNWFQQDDVMNMAHDDHAQDTMPSGHLKSTLNDKIQSAKRNKTQNHNAHEPTVPGSFVQRPAQDSDDIFGRNSHMNSLDHPDQNAPLQALNRVMSAPSLPQVHNNGSSTDGIPDLSGLPKFPVPPGAKSSLKRAGLSQNQIDLLSALIAQHQTTLAGGTAKPAPALPMLELKADPKDSMAFRSGVNSPASNYSSESSSVSSSFLGSQSQAGDNYPSVELSTPMVDLEKRRRNTAASARFRVKKKMKERDMDEKIKQLAKAVKEFEVKIDDLEMENRLLKGLIIEKGNRDSDEELKKLRDRAKSIKEA